MKTRLISVTLRAKPLWLATIDDWRRKQTPIPSRSEAIRQLVEKGLGKSGKPA